MNKNSIYFLFSIEVIFLNKIGGLSDYVHSFAKTLLKEGFQVIVIAPYFSNISKVEIDFDIADSHIVPFFGNQESFASRSVIFEGVNYCLLQNKTFFSNNRMFTTGHKDYNRNLDWLIAFGKFATKYCTHYLNDRKYDQVILQGNDWYSSFFLIYLDAILKYENLRTVYTILNAGREYIGKIYCNDLKALGHEFQQSQKIIADTCENWTQFFLNVTDVAVTVSEGYKYELLQLPSLKNILQTKGEKYIAYLLGVDEDYWSPINKEKKTNLPHVLRKYDERIYSFVGRICEQKGISLINSLFKINNTFQINLLGVGESLNKYIDESFLDSNVQHFTQYSDDLAKTIFEKSDFLIVPSLYEPCGYVAMYSARLGSIPFLRKTGGLIDIGTKISNAINKSVFFEDSKGLNELIHEFSLCSDEEINQMKSKLKTIPWGWNLENFIKVISI